jgi:hypothetical protein
VPRGLEHLLEANEIVEFAVVDECDLTVFCSQRLVAGRCEIDDAQPVVCECHSALRVDKVATVVGAAVRYGIRHGREIFLIPRLSWL